MSVLASETVSHSTLSALVVDGGGAVLVSDAGEVEKLPLARARTAAAGRTVLVCHAKLTANRLGVESLEALDILELFAFVRPGRFCVPTPRGLAQVLDFTPPRGAESAALTLWRARESLLDELADLSGEAARRAAALARVMQRGGWKWARDVLSALGHVPSEEDTAKALAVWNHLPEWEEIVPPNETPAHVEPATARQHLARLLEKVTHGEPRPQQSDYASAVSAAFAAPAEHPHLVLAEAGTGVGKTLGYLAPASLWAKESGKPVWISTYTRNLQRQIEAECRRLPEVKATLRKGRENYLCLLNYEEAVRASLANLQSLVPLGLLARWLDVTQDGDIRGGDLPGWMADVVGRSRLFWLADRRGECLHGACPHCKKCFIERSVRAARHADIVIANHALVFSAAAKGGVDEQFPPSRFVFDEGHHVFQAADSAFGADLSGAATHELRRWLLGGEGRSKNRVRGLSKRAEPLLPDGEEGPALLDSIKQHAVVLPGEGWLKRLEEGQPKGAAERFLLALAMMVQERDPDSASPYSLECPSHDPTQEVAECAARLALELKGLIEPVREFRKLLDNRQTEKEQDTETNTRLASIIRTLDTYVLEQLDAWRTMLAAFIPSPANSGGGSGRGQEKTEYVDWCGVERVEGRMLDAGLYRRFLDPTKPMAESLQHQASGLVFTSATLTDPGSDSENGWSRAEAECGVPHFPAPAVRARVPSPFDYAKQTRVLVVTDVNPKDDAAVTRAYRDLFLAAGGGALGLFTAIERLKRVHAGLKAPLAEAGLPLYAQHLDGLEPNTLIDIFRAEEDACLLGTDAVRDGVDVPGRALRLIVFDRIPWPRTDLLLKARKNAFGGAHYAERLTRQKLRQAFGRLIRRADDHGVFVLLSPLPSRLASAFPGVQPERVTLNEAIRLCAQTLTLTT